MSVIHHSEGRMARRLLPPEIDLLRRLAFSLPGSSGQVVAEAFRRATGRRVGYKTVLRHWGRPKVHPRRLPAGRA
jgi:hypothetical protein